MIIEPESIILRDGRRAVLRTPRAADADAMIDYMKTVSGETPFLLRTPEDNAGMTVEKEIDYLEGSAKFPDGAMITAFDGDIAAGNCQLVFSSKFKIRHRASVAIAIRRSYWGLGIGTAMFKKMEALARRRGEETGTSGMQLELEYIGGNDRARALYEKLGFVTFGVRPDAYRFQDGTSRDEYFMYKQL